MTDPNGSAKASQAALAAAALAKVYREVRSDVLYRVSVSEVTVGVLRSIWQAAVRGVAYDSMRDTARVVGSKGSDRFAVEPTEEYLGALADNFAKTWHENLDQSLSRVSANFDATVQELLAESQRRLDKAVKEAETDAEEITDKAANFASLEAAELEGKTTKTWHTSGDDDTRASHAALNGVTIPIGGRFANGLRYPKSPGPPREVVNCKCYLTYGG